MTDTSEYRYPPGQETWPWVIRPEPGIIPGSDILSEPYACLRFNREWLPHVLGALGVLDDARAWAGSDAEVDAARQQVRRLFVELINGLCQDDDVITDIRFNNCVLEIKRGTNDKYVPVPGFDPSCFQGPPGPQGPQGAPGASGGSGGCLPAGTLIPWATRQEQFDPPPTPPPGYLYADGSFINGDVYPELAAVIGPTWGFQEPFDFALPDMRNAMLLGADFPANIFPGPNGQAQIIRDPLQGEPVFVQRTYWIISTGQCDAAGVDLRMRIADCSVEYSTDGGQNYQAAEGSLCDCECGPDVDGCTFAANMALFISRDMQELYRARGDNGVYLAAAQEWVFTRYDDWLRLYLRERPQLFQPVPEAFLIGSEVTPWVAAMEPYVCAPAEPPNAPGCSSFFATDADGFYARANTLADDFACIASFFVARLADNQSLPSDAMLQLRNDLTGNGYQDLSDWLEAANPQYLRDIADRARTTPGQYDCESFGCVSVEPVQFEMLPGDPRISTQPAGSQSFSGACDGLTVGGLYEGGSFIVDFGQPVRLTRFEVIAKQRGFSSSTNQSRNYTFTYTLGGLTYTSPTPGSTSTVCTSLDATGISVEAQTVQISWEPIDMTLPTVPFLLVKIEGVYEPV